MSADEARIALDRRRLVLACPDDEDLSLRVEEKLRPVERKFQFLHAIGKSTQAPRPEIAGVDMQDRDRDGEYRQADDEGERRDPSRFVGKETEIAEPREMGILDGICRKTRKAAEKRSRQPFPALACPPMQRAASRAACLSRTAGGRRESILMQSARPRDGSLVCGQFLHFEVGAPRAPIELNSDNDPA